ncbi:MAG: glycosyltransferase family 4 protein [Candidatus Roizmanbacteria bacterium]|nr:glycosyltransferase family 4 protein [Candidatus Roizmanbacteria bacterium]
MENTSSIKQKKSTKLLFFSPYFYPYISGITQYPYKLFSEDTLLCDTTCLTFRYDPTLKREEKISKNLTIRRMPFQFRISKGFISLSSLNYFWNEAKKAEIVVVNLPSFEGIVLVLTAKLLKKPLLILLHCEVQLPYSVMNVIINFVLNCGVMLQLFFADKIIVETKDYFAKKLPYIFFKNKISELLPLVNDTQLDIQFKNKLDDLKKEYSHVVGFCGRIASEKGIEILIESLSEIKKTMLLLVGPTGKNVSGEEEYYDKIKQHLSLKKIPHMFLGILSASELSSFYQSIDILVLPSINKTEAFGMVQAEAMIQGAPVVATYLPGVRIPIQLTKMGILTEPYNVQDLRKAIQQILSNKEQYANHKLVAAAKNIFDSKKTYDSMYSIIRHMTHSIS